MAEYWMWTHGVSGLIGNTANPQERALSFSISPHGALEVGQKAGTTNSILFAIPTIAADPQKRYAVREVILVYTCNPVRSIWPVGPGVQAEITEVSVSDGSTLLQTFSFRDGQNRNNSRFWVLPKLWALNTGLLLSVHVRWREGGNCPTLLFYSAGARLVETRV